MIGLECSMRQRVSAYFRSVYRAENPRLGVIYLHLSVPQGTQTYMSTLITSGIGITQDRLDDLVAAGCDHVQLSLQDVDPDGARLISNMNKSLEKKLEFAGSVAGGPYL